MEFLKQDILDYCEKFSQQPNKIIQELERETKYKVLMPRMMSDQLMGSFLELISGIMQPKYILEIGTYTGYSAICLANGLHKNGQLHTIEINPELEDIAHKYFKKLNLDNKIITHIGHALDIIPKLNYLFDIVFIDADKKNYCNYYELAIKKVKKGGLILIDNVLWSGKVLNTPKHNDLETKEIKKLNQIILEDKRVKNMILPLRDGIMICQLL